MLRCFLVHCISPMFIKYVRYKATTSSLPLTSSPSSSWTQIIIIIRQTADMAALNNTIILFLSLRAKSATSSTNIFSSVAGTPQLTPTLKSSEPANRSIMRRQASCTPKTSSGSSSTGAAFSPTRSHSTPPTNYSYLPTSQTSLTSHPSLPTSHFSGSRNWRSTSGVFSNPLTTRNWKWAS